MAKQKSNHRSTERIESVWRELNQDIVGCQRCPRLTQYCEEVARKKRRAFLDQEYWGRPVGNLVSPRPAGRSSGKRSLVIVGLAPGAHGANRTGRMFTGDRSGDWLYRALHRGGFANQAESRDVNDGLRLDQAIITAVCHCAPPGNKPTGEEVAQCREYLDRTLTIARPRVILALGKLAWDATVRQIRNSESVRRVMGISVDLSAPGRRPPGFSHGQRWEIADRLTLLGSYHPSQQNTFTGRLTEAMLDDVIRIAREILDSE